ncbi:glycosyltransferase family 4 protein [Methylopila turkensis]|uniref:Glycosyl transferase n=1 Tax=Methylopila turkensis TaxID=1437816 RepID=A0A9W6N825_9HYPH|nr:glycosyltransferase family 4 protein [Methylopila turkensis]GLK81040.1 glycosyl transferase [Methylopila turkensis]
MPNAHRSLLVQPNIFAEDAAPRPAGRAAAATSRPLRIVHIVRSPFGGIGRHIFDLAAAQSEAGHEVGFVCDSLTLTPFEIARIEAVKPHLALGAMTLPIARQIAVSDLGALRAVHGLLGPIAPDVIHTHGAKGGAFGRLVGAWSGRSRPIVKIYAPHGGSLHYDPASLEGRVYFKLERALERATDALVHVSEFERLAYVDKIGAPRCPAAVIRNGLAPHEFDPVAPAPDATDILYLGMLRDLKGVDVLLDALTTLNAGARRVTATIVGDGPDEARYRAIVAERGLGDAIRFRPATPAREAFALGRLIVVPSRAESLPYVVLEAIAAGLPIIATDVGGIPEIFGPYADALVPAGDSEALAAAIGDRLGDEAVARSRAAALKRHISGEFSRQAMAAGVETVYRKAIEAASREA